jgi:cell division protease FtsH
MEDRNYSEEVATAIDEEQRAIIENCYNRARELLQQHRDLMDRIVEVLLERETIGREEFLALMRGEPLPEPAAPKNPPSASAPTEEPGEKRAPHSPPSLRTHPEPA